MRLRLGAFALTASVLAVSAGGCKVTGASAIYMAIDSAGAQPRNTFFTDTENIYCVALVSSGTPDDVVDFTVLQVAGPDSPRPIHTVFAVGETTPGVGTETPVAYQVPPNGIEIQVMCNGVCLQNGIGCPTGYLDQGNDSCGIGATCCFNALVMGGSGPPTDLPYPVGDYRCEVEINGKLVGSSDFSIKYPPASPPSKQFPKGQICPVPPPVTGITCADWVPQGAQCVGFNSFETCTCKGASWNCVASQ